MATTLDSGTGPCLEDPLSVTHVYAVPPVSPVLPTGMVNLTSGVLYEIC